MVDWADDLKKKLGQNPPPAASVKEAGEAVQESEKQLEKLAEKKARLLESISKKVETLKALVSQAANATEEGSFADASALWKQVLELDPQNPDAQVGLELCQSRLADMAPPSAFQEASPAESPVSETSVIPEPEAVSVTTPPLQESAAVPESAPLLLEEPGISDAVSPLVPVAEEAAPLEIPSPDATPLASAEEAPAASMPQNELDSLLSQISETAPQATALESSLDLQSKTEPLPLATPPMSAKELDRVLSDIQGDPSPSENIPLTQEAAPLIPEAVPVEKNLEPPIPESAAAAPKAALPDPAATPASLPEEDEGAKELEAVLNEVNQTQMQALVEPPPQIDQTEVMDRDTPAPEAPTKEVTAKLDQIKTAIPAGTYQTPAATTPATAPASRRNWILGACVALLVFLVSALAYVVLSMFETPTALVQKHPEVKAKPVFTVDDTLLEAKKHLESGKIQDALETILQIKDRYPTPSKMVEDWLRAARMMDERFQKEENVSRKKEWAAAVTTVYEKVIDQFPRDEKIAEAYYRVAECYADLGAYSRAFSYYDALIKYYPDFEDFEEAVYARARMLLEQDKFQECREAYLKIIKDFPRSKMAKWSELDIAKSYKLESSKGSQSPV